MENKVQSTLKDLHERSLTSIDKANGSVGFTRKKFYELTLFRELGIPNSQSKKAYKNCKNVQSNLYIANLYIADTYISQKSALSFDVRYVEVFSYESIVIHGVLKAYCKDSEILLEQSAIYKTLSFSLSRKYQYIIPLESFHSTFLRSNVCASSF